MATEVASAYVSIGASTRGLGNDIRKEFGGIESSAGTAGASIGRKLVTPIAAAFATVGVGKFFADAVNEASDLTEAGTALSAVFGDSVDVVNAFASGGARALGQTELAVKNAAQTFGVYGAAAGLASDANATFSTDLVSLSTDLASFYNANPADVVEALGAGLRGEAEPLRRFGILLDDATLRAKALELGIYDGNGSLTQQQKILAAQASIMEQSTIAQGDFAKTSGGLANQQRILSATWTNFTGAIGSAFLPVVTSVVTKLNELAGPVLDAVSSGVQGAVDWVSQLASGFSGVASAGDFFARFSSVATGMIEDLVANLPDLVADLVPRMVDGILSRYSLLIDAVTKVIDGVVDLLPTLLPTIVSGAVELFTGIITAVTTIIPQLINTLVRLIPTIVQTFISLLPVLIQGALTLFGALIQAVIQIIPPLITAIVELLPVLIEALLGMVPQLIEGALTLFTAIVTAIPQIIPPLIDGIVTLLPEIVGALLGLIPQLIMGALDLFLAIVTAIPQIVPQLIRGILDLLPTLLSTVVGMIPQLIDAAFDLFIGIVEAIPQIVPDLITGVLGLLPEIVGTLLGMIPDLIQAGVDMIGGLVQGLWSAADSVGEALLNIAKDSIDGFLGFLGISSPSKLMEGYGENTGEGFAIGVEGMRSRAKEALLGLASAAPSVQASATSALETMATTSVPDAPYSPTYNISGLTSSEVGAVVDAKMQEVMSR